MADTGMASTQPAAQPPGPPPPTGVTPRVPSVELRRRSGAVFSHMPQVDDDELPPIDTGPESPAAPPAPALAKKAPAPIKVDRYGQVYDGVPTPRSASSRKQEIGREKKWLKMIHPEEWPNVDPKLLKKRVRKGVPDSVRVKAWPLLCGSEERKAAHKPGHYEAMLAEKCEEDETIMKDVNRTFSSNIFFKRAEGSGKSIGREALHNVLRAYSNHDQRVGYCQGMSYLVGMFLMYVDEETAFWMTDSLLWGPKHNTHGLYEPGFPLLNKYCHVHQGLFKSFLPKLRGKFDKDNVMPQLYATAWYLTAFAVVLSPISLELVLRVMDIYLYEGVKIIYRLGMFFLKTLERKLLSADMSLTMTTLSNLPEADERFSDVEFVVGGAHAIMFSTAEMDKLGHDWEAAQRLQEMKTK